MTTLLSRLFARPRCADCQFGQGRYCRCAEELQEQRKSAGDAGRSWSPAVNVLLILALFAAVKLKLVFTAVVLAGLLGWVAWRAWA